MRRTAIALGVLGLAAALAAGCKSPRTAEADADATNASSAVSASPRPSLDADVLPGDAGTSDAAEARSPREVLHDDVRRARWENVETDAARLPPNERDAPIVRLARARAALERNDGKLAVSLLGKLEDELPLLEARVKRMRRAAMAEVGPYEVAAEGYFAEGTPKAYLSAARAYERAGNAARARLACDRAIQADKKPKSVELEARKLRLELPHDDTATDRDDARWIAVNGPTKDAERALQKLGHALPSEDWLRRAHVLAEAGDVDEALKCVERAASSKGRATADDLCHAKAEALYKSRSRYVEASQAYTTCERRGGPKAAEDAFLSARALSRADKDREAQTAMKRVRDHYAKSPFAAQAKFHIARIAYFHGDYKEASTAFDELTSSRDHGERDVPRYRALSHFMAKDYAGARRLFEALADSADESRNRARYIDLAALAALRDGDRTHAVARWSEVVRTHTLTFAALVAQGRLDEAKAPAVPWTEPSASPAVPIVVKLPAPVDALHAVGLDDDAEEELRTREAFVEGESAGRGVEALCAAYGQLERAKRRHQIALRAPQSMLSESPEGRARWVWDCAFPRPYAGAVTDAESSLGLPVGLVFGVMRQESGFDAEVVSPARAVGLLQLLPETAKAVAERAGTPFDPAELTRPEANVRLGARYLRELSDKLDADPLRVAAAYNAGPDAVVKWHARSAGVDVEVFVESIPYGETRGYVVRVLENMARYALLTKGAAAVPRVKLTL
ncbi:MAG: transglycosylase SLT domain-containing protein [Myxococcales bacterium]|nr:transglycosylase SLT domain-containing protein [Myxococcales bacterium]